VTIGGADKGDLARVILVRGFLRDIDSKNDFFPSGACFLQPADRMVRIKCLER
jgi:hypothetical protein